MLNVIQYQPRKWRQRTTNLSPKWFFAILFKTIQTFDDQKSEEEVCVSELRLDKNEKRTQFTPIFES